MTEYRGWGLFLNLKSLLHLFYTSYYQSSDKYMTLAQSSA